MTSQIKGMTSRDMYTLVTCVAFGLDVDIFVSVTDLGLADDANDLVNGGAWLTELAFLSNLPTCVDLKPTRRNI